MKDNKQHIEPQDPFSELIKQKLEGHQMPVDADAWERLEEKLHQKRRKPILWWFVIGSAAMLALLISIQPLVDDSTNQLSYEQIEKQNFLDKNLSNQKNEFDKDEANSPANDYAKVQDNQDSGLKQAPQIKKEIVSRSEESSLIKEKLIEESKISNSVETTKQDINNNLEKQNSRESQKSIIAEASADTIINPKKTIKKIDELPAIESKDVPEPKSKKKRNWLLAAAFGSSGNATVAKPNDMFFSEVGNRNLVKAATSYTRILRADDFSNKSFSTPLSFGLTVRKEISDRLGIETGLVYTYLNTFFEENKISHYDADLSLHYLGIPVNLIVPIWKDRKWEVYFSGGGMVEKGLRSIYTQNEYVGTEIVTTNAETNIEGLQWSANAAVGGMFNLQRNIGIYFEPKFSYYFDNEQPISARTDQPVVIGLNAGVRFKL